MNNKNNLSLKGIFILVVGLIITIIETVYFGGNILPKSIKELFIDFLSFTIVFYGLKISNMYI